jgi:hypothetical protein
MNSQRSIARRERAPRLLRISDPDDGNRISVGAFNALQAYHRSTVEDLVLLLRRELPPLIPIAYQTNRHQRALYTSYDFTAQDNTIALYCMVNNYGGITLLLPRERGSITAQDG